MSNEQKQNAAEAIAAEQTVLLIELDENQQAVAKYLDKDMDELNAMAQSAFSSVLRGKVESVINRCIKDKYIADNKGKKAVSAELENEIQILIKLKRSIS